MKKLELKRSKQEFCDIKIVCWWSGGVTSAVVCKIMIDKYNSSNCRIIMIDTRNEHDDTYRFLKDCEKWYGQEIEIIKSNDYENIQETWYRHKSLNTANGAVCSYMLKRRVREKWEKENNFDHQIFGFEFSKKEMNRAKSLTQNHSHTKPLFPLIDGKLTKTDCIEIVKRAGIKIPEPYSLGFNNNNCLKTGCVQGGIGYWKKIQFEMPEKFEVMAKVEHELTNMKGQPVTILKDQSKLAKQIGVELVFLKSHPDYPQHKSIDDMKGRKVESLEECNGFCENNYCK